MNLGHDEFLGFVKIFKINSISLVMGILSGLERIIVWTLKKTKPEKKDTKFVKALEYTLSGIAYPITGAFPAEIQGIEGKKAGINPLKFTKYSIGATVVTGFLKYAAGHNADDMVMLNYLSDSLSNCAEYYFGWETKDILEGAFRDWFLAGNISILARGIYVKASKKPIGSLIVEGLYHIMPYKINEKYEKRNNHIATKGLIEKGK